MDITKDRTKDLVRDVNKEVDGFAMRPLAPWHGLRATAGRFGVKSLPVL